jgi:hypothetical protein
VAAGHIGCSHVQPRQLAEEEVKGKVMNVRTVDVGVMVMMMMLWIAQLVDVVDYHGQYHS